jgi:hypothetical protein
MKTSRDTEVQIRSILRQPEGGIRVAGLCREHGVVPLRGNGLPSNHKRESVVL